MAGTSYLLAIDQGTTSTRAILFDADGAQRAVAQRELAQIFPEQPLQRLSSDHPIFHSYHDIDRVAYCPGVRKSGFKGNEPWFDGIEINCRVVALVSRWGMAVGWEGEVKDEFQAYQPESAYRLGVNVFSYASAMRAWAKTCL